MPEGASVEEYRTVAGIAKVFFIPEALEVRVVADKRLSKAVRTDVAIAEAEEEVLLSDKLLGKLEVVPERPDKGLWRFRDEPTASLRKSVPAERHA